MASTAVFHPTDESIGQPELLGKKLHQMRPGITLYFGGDEWKQIQVHGNFMWFPPDKKGKTVFHPTATDQDGRPLAVVGDGRVEIKDRYGYIYTRVPGMPAGQPSWGAVKGEDVVSQVRFIIRKHPYIVVLYGDRSDSAQIARAKEAWYGSRVQWARQVMARRRAYLEDFKRNQPGITPPPPTERQNQAQRILDANVGSSAWKEFPCRFLDAHYDTFEELQEHMKRTHNEILKAAPGSTEAKEEEE